MKNAAPRRWLLISFVALATTLVGQDRPKAQQMPEGTDLSIELVDPKVLRVCADPRNMPFSNEKGEGIENRLAELFAAKLKKKLDYMYFPQATGFVKMTLGAHRCDVIMGFPQGDDLVQGTNPYYRTAYALVTKAGSGLDEVATLEDARLKGKRIGIQEPGGSWQDLPIPDRHRKVPNAVPSLGVLNVAQLYAHIAVAENRRSVASAFHVQASDLTTCFQVHSSRVSVARSPWGARRPRGDGACQPDAGRDHLPGPDLPPAGPAADRGRERRGAVRRGAGRREPGARLL